MPYSKLELKVRRLERNYNAARLCRESAMREYDKYTMDVHTLRIKLDHAKSELEEERESLAEV